MTSDCMSWSVIRLMCPFRTYQRKGEGEGGEADHRSEDGQEQEMSR